MALDEQQAKDREGDPELVSTEGTVDGGIFRVPGGPLRVAAGRRRGAGLGFDDIGKREHGRPSTLHFCDELQRLYGSEDAQVAEGASFAVENWAAAGFWQELEDGLMRIKRERHPHLRLAFFTWHNRVEAQHAGHTMEELEEVYFDPGFSRIEASSGAREVLDAIAGLLGRPEARSPEPARRLVQWLRRSPDGRGVAHDQPRHAPSAHRPRPLLRRQRPAVGVLLPQRLRLRRGRLRRAGDGVRHEAGYVLRQGEITFVLASPLGADHPDNARLVRPRRRRRRTSPSEVDDVAAAYETAVRAGRASGMTPPPTTEDETASTSPPRSAPTATRRTASSTATATGAVRPRLQAARPGPLQPPHASTPSA